MAEDPQAKLKIMAHVTNSGFMLFLINYDIDDSEKSHLAGYNKVLRKH